jgi:hypothetical protein
MGRPSFAEWSTSFEKQSVPIPGSDGDLYQGSVREALDRLQAIQPRRLSTKELRTSLLHACYEASFAPDPASDAAASDRRDQREGYARLAKHRRDVARVLAYVERHERVPRMALSPVRAFIVPQSLEALHELRQMLKKYGDGLKAIPTKRLMYRVRYGAMELVVSRPDYRYSPQKIRQDSLMVHLTYLFRYFTAEHLHEPEAYLRRDGVVEISGTFNGGDPHTGVVALLVNAVFKTKFKARQIQERLRDLKRKTRGARMARNVQFVGY